MHQQVSARGADAGDGLDHHRLDARRQHEEHVHAAPHLQRVTIKSIRSLNARFYRLFCH